MMLRYYRRLFPKKDKYDRVITPEGIVKFLLNGRRHNLHGPAVFHPSGAEEWWINGRRHREDGPASTWPNGSYIWWQTGLKHRFDGPAYYNADTGEKEWYIYNKKTQDLTTYTGVENG